MLWQPSESDEATAGSPPPSKRQQQSRPPQAVLSSAEFAECFATTSESDNNGDAPTNAKERHTKTTPVKKSNAAIGAANGCVPLSGPPPHSKHSEAATDSSDRHVTAGEGGVYPSRSDWGGGGGGEGGGSGSTADKGHRHSLLTAETAMVRIHSSGDYANAEANVNAAERRLSVGPAKPFLRSAYSTTGANADSRRDTNNGDSSNAAAAAATKRREQFIADHRRRSSSVYEFSGDVSAEYGGGGGDPNGLSALRSGGLLMAGDPATLSRSTSAATSPDDKALFDAAAAATTVGGTARPAPPPPLFSPTPLVAPNTARGQPMTDAAFANSVLSSYDTAHSDGGGNSRAAPSSLQQSHKGSNSSGRLASTGASLRSPHSPPPLAAATAKSPSPARGAAKAAPSTAAAVAAVKGGNSANANSPIGSPTAATAVGRRGVGGAASFRSTSTGRSPNSPLGSSPTQQQSPRQPIAGRRSK